MTTIIDGTSGITTPMYNGSITANPVTPSVNMKNRIINGAMMIDQRNAGASVTPAGGNSTYTLDRWRFYTSVSSKFTVQQNVNSVTPPVGFTNYLGITSSSAYSVAAGDIIVMNQYIEGYNFADLGWGTANAKTITISFWARSSLTGNFGGYITTNTGSRYYSYSYTISSANTWEYKTITIAGDTSASWSTSSTNGVGAEIGWAVSVGTNYNGTANTWGSSANLAPTGSVNLVGTNGATLYITGVQLEVGSTASSFDYRQYGTELVLCQRYYEEIGRASAGGVLAPVGYATSGQISTTLLYKVTKRAAPTVTKVGTWNLINMASQPNIYGGDVDSVLFYANVSSSGGGYAQNSNSGNYVTISAEL